MNDIGIGSSPLWRVLRRGARAAAVVMLIAPGILLAHGALRSSQPKSGAKLDAAPRQLRLVFNEAIELSLARLTLAGPDSQKVALGVLRQPGDSSTLLVAEITGPLHATGAYTVTWEIVGRDGHPVRGHFGFTIAEGAVGLAPAAVAPPQAVRSDTGAAIESRLAPRPAQVAEGDGVLAPPFIFARWLGYAALLALIGVMMVRFPLLARLDRMDASHRRGLSSLRLRAATFGAVAAAILLVAIGLRLLAQTRAMGAGAAAGDLALVGNLLGGTWWGRAWSVQLAAAAIAALALMGARRGADRAWIVAALAVAVAACIQPLFGHAAAARLASLSVAVAGLHILGAGGWLGTLLVLVAVGLPVALCAPEAERGPVAAALIDAFSPFALAFAAATAVSGAISGWIHLGTLGALFASAYGRVLMIKLGVIVVVAASGAWNWRRMKPALCDERSARQLRRSATVEVALGALVLAATAVLVAMPTPVDLLR